MALLTRRRPLSRVAFDRVIEEYQNALNGAYNESADFALALDIHETETGYNVSTELPGVNPEDIDIRLHDDVLTISAEMQEETVEEGAKVVIKERRYGKTSRSLRLSNKVNADGIEADYDNGVLKLFIPKAEEVQPRIIPVKNGANNS